MEILAKELRIGNLINNGEFGVGIICSVDYDSVELDVKSNEEFTETALLIESMPILITEEWINKAGFKDGLIDDYKSLPIGNDTFLSSGGDSVWIDKVIDYKTFSVGNSGAKYVHELQNLFFVLNGTELQFENES